jgi:hypothetical protein
LKQSGHSVLILTTRKLHTAPRVLREIQVLANDYRIVTVGHTPAESTIPVEFIDAKTIRQSLPERIVNIISRVLRVSPPLIGSLSLRLSDIKHLVERTRPEVIITHEPHFLPYLKKLKDIWQFKIVYNAHEYHPLEFSDYWYWNMFWKPYYENIYRSCLPSVDLFINVCDSIAKKCYSEFGKDSIVIPNASVFHDLSPSETDDGQIRIIHHGGCIPSRKIEVMIEVARLLGDRYQLDLMLTLTEGAYYESIKKLVSEIPNVKLIPPVKFDQIVPFTNQYDIGLFLLPPTNYNYSVALPNKLFEFIQARLCVAIGPSPEMMKYVNTYDLGVVSKDFTAESMATAIGSLDVSTIQTFKQNSDRSAKKLSAETFNKLFSDSVNKIKKN